MRAFFRTFLAVLSATVVLLAVVIAAVGLTLDRSSRIKDHSWLHLDLVGELPEYDPPGGLLDRLTGGGQTLQKILTGLAMAQVDDRIDGVVLQMSSGHEAGWAKLQEIRNAVHRLRDAGKKVYGFADDMDQKTYVLAAACDSLYCPPSAYITFTGLAGHSVHVKGALDKLGIRPELDPIREYKSAAQLVTRKDLTPEARRNREWILDEGWEQFCAALTADRGLAEQKITELMAHALFTAEEAAAAGLFDEVLYWDQLEARLKRPGDERLRLVGGERYAEEDPRDLGLKGKRKIAVVHAQGMIGGRQSRVHPLLGVMMGHQTVIADLERALRDDDVVAIVLRVDSRGGDSLTSDLIGHAVERIGKVKPVIVSMVDVAASGGYSVSYRATRILADPFTITGSIGSISGKFDLSALFERLGVTHEHVARGPMALLGVADRSFTPQEWQRFTENHRRDFDRWMYDVADRRGIPREQIESLCLGRVWTGRQAAANGLIDQVGDLHAAVEVAKFEGGLAPEQKVTLWHLPEKKGFLQTLLGGGDDARQAVNWALHRELRLQALDAWRALCGERRQVLDPGFMN